LRWNLNSRMKSYESMIFCEKLSIQFFVAQQIHHESIKSSYVEVRFEIIRNKYINKKNMLTPPPPPMIPALDFNRRGHCKWMNEKAGETLPPQATEWMESEFTRLMLINVIMITTWEIKVTTWWQKKIKIRQLEWMISSVPIDGYQVLRFLRYFNRCRCCHLNLVGAKEDIWPL